MDLHRSSRYLIAEDIVSLLDTWSYTTDFLLGFWDGSGGLLSLLLLLLLLLLFFLSSCGWGSSSWLLIKDRALTAISTAKLDGGSPTWSVVNFDGSDSLTVSALFHINFFYYKL